MTGQRRAVRVILFDDAPLHAGMFADELEEAGAEVLRAVSTADEMHEVIRSTEFDVAVLDLLVGRAREMTGLRIGLWLRENLPRARVIMLTSCDSPFPALRLLDAGPPGVGYLLKNEVQRTSEITAALDRVRSRRDAVAPGIAEQLPLARRTAGQVARLTPTDLRTVELVVEGWTNPQIGDELGVTGKTIDARLTGIYRVLGIGEDGTGPAGKRVKLVEFWQRARLFLAARDVRPVGWSTPGSAERGA